MSESLAKTVSRKQLYDLVWSKPMIHAAAEFGVSGNGLAKVCRKLDVPYPPRGYWAKHAVGKAPPANPLPDRRKDIPEGVTIGASGKLDDEERPEIAQARADFEEAKQRHAAISIPERLAKPHPVIARWLSEKKERQERARRERDPWTRSLYREPDFTTVDRRRHRILHALFAILEKEGGAVVENERRELRYERDGVSLEFQLREKFKQVRRPLTEDEKRWRLSSDRDWRLDLEATGMLLFEFKTWSLGRLRKNWLESEAKSMKTMLPGIVATFAAAIPLLVEESARAKSRQSAGARPSGDARRKRTAGCSRRRAGASSWSWPAGRARPTLQGSSSSGSGPAIRIR